MLYKNKSNKVHASAFIMINILNVVLTQKIADKNVPFLPLYSKTKNGDLSWRLGKAKTKNGYRKEWKSYQTIKELNSNVSF